MRARNLRPGYTLIELVVTVMIIGVPKEIKDHETRVGLAPSGVTVLREAGHRVLVETHAGEGSSITDREYLEAGAIGTVVVFALAWLLARSLVPKSRDDAAPPRR